ncbi:Lar family restriction alleviation protein [Sphingomonas sp. CCH5-D11]|uniref:Lar family restriction alleviation protein n=1 Tax=Sphingomonas sp. CCH5-D11 TaxID=1768786 RepID=UPI000831E55E|nr:Lar family restriction alleviation protein [Sphingomonas sp. CCH5-D11]
MPGEELLACPFCGYHAEIEGSGIVDDWQAVCQNVTCTAQSAHFVAKEQAVAAWNTRLAHSASTREGEASRPLPTREEVAEAAYTAHVKRNKPWAQETLWAKERWRASADAILALLSREAQS